MISSNSNQGCIVPLMDVFAALVNIYCIPQGTLFGLQDDLKSEFEPNFMIDMLWADSVKHERHNVSYPSKIIMKYHLV